MNKRINSDKAPKAIGPYSQAILAGNTLYISGQLPIKPETNEMLSGIIDQTSMCLNNIKAILLEASFNIEDVVKCTVYMKDLSHFGEMNKVYEDFFKSHKPARVAFEVAKLPKDALIEIDCIAVK